MNKLQRMVGMDKLSPSKLLASYKMHSDVGCIKVEDIMR